MGPAEHASGHRPYSKNLQSGSSAGASDQRDMSKIICHYCKKPGHMIADSRKRQNANSRRQSDTAHLAAPPETPTESETYQSSYSKCLYSLRYAPQSFAFSAVSGVVPSTPLWHRRLGHVFSPRLRYFISTGMLGSVPNIEISTCMG